MDCKVPAVPSLLPSCGPRWKEGGEDRQPRKKHDLTPQVINMGLITPGDDPGGTKT